MTQQGDASKRRPVDDRFIVSIYSSDRSSCCRPRRELRSFANRVIPATIESGSRCASAITSASVRQVEQFAAAIDRRGSALRLIGVGGIFRLQDVLAYLSAGAHAVHLATSAMLEPDIALRLREQLADHSGQAPIT